MDSLYIGSLFIFFFFLLFLENLFLLIIVILVLVVFRLLLFDLARMVAIVVDVPIIVMRPILSLDFGLVWPCNLCDSIL